MLIRSFQAQANKQKREKKADISTWPEGSWSRGRGEVEALWTEEGEIVWGARCCWEEEKEKETMEEI